MPRRASPGPGIRRHGSGWQVRVQVGRARVITQFALNAQPAEMKAWRTREQAKLHLQHPRAESGTFAADAAKYLRTVAAMPSIKDRRKDIGRWVTLFGKRRRSSVTSADIRAQRDAWMAHGDPAPTDSPNLLKTQTTPGRRMLAPSTINHRLRALSNLYTVLDGRRAPNPVREVPEVDEGDPEPRGLPYDVVNAILDAMPDQGRAERHGTRPSSSKTKARLRVIAWTGLSHAELMRLQPKHVDLEAGTIYVERRRKGKGSKATVRPLLPEAIEALRAFTRLGCWGPFSASAMWKSFQVACKSLSLEGLRPYDLRHSFASAIYTHSGDLASTQYLLGHRSPKTTLRYTSRAVPAVIAAAIEKVRAARASEAGSV